MDGGYGEIP